MKKSFLIISIISYGKEKLKKKQKGTIIMIFLLTKLVDSRQTVVYTLTPRLDVISIELMG
nr:MAG TPA: hypothetical protein [Caudoviricetes sp.]